MKEIKILKIDIDVNTPEWWRALWIRTRLEMLRWLGCSSVRFNEIKSTRGYNYIIEIDKDLPDETINLIQFLLGDDHTRVKINSWRIERGVKRWNKIFSRKIYRKTSKVIDCWYCGNKIPIPKEILNSVMQKTDKPNG